MVKEEKRKESKRLKVRQFRSIKQRMRLSVGTTPVYYDNARVCRDEQPSVMFLFIRGHKLG
jgi:hypothetical protein